MIRRMVASLLVVSSVLAVAPVYATFASAFSWGTANGGSRSETGGVAATRDPGSDPHESPVPQQRRDRYQGGDHS